MWGRILALALLAQLCSCQDAAEEVRRLRFRRPRPKIIDVVNPDGDLVGSPVELRLQEVAEEEAEDLVAAAQNARQSFPARQNSGSAALDALIATAQREEPSLPAPQLLEIEEVPTRRPLEAEAPRRQRPRNRGGVPARQRPRRPDGEESVVANGGSRRRPAAQREEPVATLERYSHKNEDGSFTFGYVGADGSFREETRGADCITRGKYGYIDPDGVKREYSYTSGLPCEVGEGAVGEDLENNNVEDTIPSNERFRQTKDEQLDNTQIPQIRQEQILNRQRGQPQRQRPQAEAPQRQEPPRQRPQRPVAPQTNTFANFGSQGAAAGSPLQNLLTIADPSAALAAPRRPAPTRAPVRIAPRPAQPAQPAQPARGSFNFDSELEGFTLNRPAIKFDQSAAPAPVKNQFESQLSFNQNTGVFQTSLQQSLPGGGVINTNNPAAPTGQSATTRAPATTRAQPTTRLPPTTLQRVAVPAPTSPRPQTLVPAGTVRLQPAALPLAIPKDIGQVKQSAAPVEAPRTAAKPAPTPAPAPKAAPAPPQAQPAPGAQTPNNKFFVFQPFNQQPASAPFRTPVNHNAFQIQPQANPAQPPQSAPTLVSQGGRPLGAPLAPRPTPVNQAAFQIQPRPAVGRPAPRPAPQAARPAPRPAPVPARPQPVPQSQLPPGVFAVPAGQPIPQGAIRVNTQGQAINPQGQRIPEPARPSTPEQPRRPQSAPQPGGPQLQFGFQPVSQGAPQPVVRQPPQGAPRPASQGAPRPAPQGAPRPGPQRPGQGRPQAFTAFTAFGSGPPRSQPAPQRPARPGQLGVPPQLQQPGQFSQFDSRFAPRPGAPPSQFRPAQFQPGAQPGFNVFNPAQLRGA